MVMKETDIKILKKIEKENRNWAPRTRSGYVNAVNRYIEFHNMSLTELIKEANNELNKGIRWKDQKLKDRLLRFRAWLYNKYLLKTARRIKHITPNII